MTVRTSEFNVERFSDSYSIRNQSSNVQFLNFYLPTSVWWDFFNLQEKLFVDSQERRRNTQTAINDVQVKLKSIRSELERTARGDDKYLALVTEEHSIIKEEFSLASQLENVERLEKEKFSRLTRAVRDSHEKARLYILG